MRGNISSTKSRCGAVGAESQKTNAKVPSGCSRFGCDYSGAGVSMFCACFSVLIHVCYCFRVHFECVCGRVGARVVCYHCCTGERAAMCYCCHLLIFLNANLHHSHTYAWMRDESDVFADRTTRRQPAGQPIKVIRSYSNLPPAAAMTICVY